MGNLLIGLIVNTTLNTSAREQNVAVLVRGPNISKKNYSRQNRMKLKESDAQDTSGLQFSINLKLAN